MLQYLKKWAQEMPDKKFINDFSFQQIWQETLKQSKHLSKLTDARVALLMNSDVPSLISLFSLLLLSKEVLLLNPSLTEREISEQISGLGIHQVLSAKTLATSLEDSEGSIEDSFESSSKTPIETADNASNIASSWDSLALDLEVASEKPVLFMNTSATSGKFKTVPISWRMIEAQCQASAQILGVKADDNWLDVLPLFHVSGLSIVMRSLYNGSRLTLANYDEALVLELVESDQLTMMSLVPTQLKSLIKRLTPHKLRMILLGGETIPLSLVESALAKGLPIYKTYGMTETFSQSVTFNSLERPDKISSVGRPLPGVTLTIDLPDQEGVGEIRLQSPMLMKGYLGQPALSQGFATGDLGYLDEEGFLYVLNRRRDVIISGGENIYPKEIEDLLYRLPEMLECALIPREDAKWGQIPVLYYAGDLLEEELRAYLADKLAKFKQPKVYYRLFELPKNPSGKILRKDLT